MSQKHPPAIQRNGFKALAEEFDVPDETLNEFLDDYFDPSLSFRENLTRWFQFFEKIDRTVSKVAESAESAEDLDDVLDDE